MRAATGVVRLGSACVVALLLAACAGSSVSDDPTSTDVTSSAATTAPPALSQDQSGEAPVAPAPTTAAPVITGVSDNRRYFLDQEGRPLLLQAETIWSLLQSLTMDEITEHLELRSSQGFNAVLLSPYPWIGRPEDTGQTPDGLTPFGDSVTDLDEAYWSRVDDVLEVARSLGITAFLAPGGANVGLEDYGYTYDVDASRGLGEALGARYRDTPGIVWLMGVDHYEPEWEAADPLMLAFVEGLRTGGDTHLVTVQLFNTSTSFDNPAWRDVNQIEAAYTYRPTYAAVLAAYAHGTAPVVLIEANFENENNEGGPPTTDETLRRQTFWTLTSGGVGVTYGELHLWRFSPGWRESRETSAVDQLEVGIDVVDGIRWWDLVPDADGSFLTSGRGEDVTTGTQEGGFADVLESDLATAAVTPDGTLAVVYVPTARTIAVDAGRLAAGAEAAWVDPTTGVAAPADLTATLTTPGRNAAGDEDWLLLITSAQS